VSAFGCRNERPNLDQLSYIEPELAYISAAAVAHERSCKRRAKARDEVYIAGLFQSGVQVTSEQGDHVGIHSGEAGRTAIRCADKSRQSYVYGIDGSVSADGRIVSRRTLECEHRSGSREDVSAAVGRHRGGNLSPDEAKHAVDRIVRSIFGRLAEAGPPP
jgi:hypothetical protein